MRRLIQGLRRLWRIATCRHLGLAVNLNYENRRGGGQTMTFCPRCGLMTSYRRWDRGPAVEAKPAAPKPPEQGVPKDETYKFN